MSLKEKLLEWSRETRDSASSLELWLEASYYFIDNNAEYAKFSSESSGITTLDNYPNSKAAKEVKNTLAKEIAHIRAMYNKIAGLDGRSDGNIPVALLRHREGESWDYRVLGLFQKGMRMYRDPEERDSLVTASSPGLVYMISVAPCMNHACDIEYKLQRNSGEVSMFPYIEVEDVPDRIKATLGVVEFMDQQTSQTKDPKAFIFAGLSGFFGNLERYRVPVRLI